MKKWITSIFLFATSCILYLAVPQSNPSCDQTEPAAKTPELAIERLKTVFGERLNSAKFQNKIGVNL